MDEPMDDTPPITAHAPRTPNPPKPYFMRIRPLQQLLGAPITRLGTGVKLA
jgi:hypothetical protein